MSKNRMSRNRMSKDRVGPREAQPLAAQPLASPPRELLANIYLALSLSLSLSLSVCLSSCRWPLLLRHSRCQSHTMPTDMLPDLLHDVTRWP